MPKLYSEELTVTKHKTGGKKRFKITKFFLKKTHLKILKKIFVSVKLKYSKLKRNNLNKARCKT